MSDLYGKILIANPFPNIIGFAYGCFGGEDGYAGDLVNAIDKIEIEIH